MLLSKLSLKKEFLNQERLVTKTVNANLNSNRGKEHQIEGYRKSN